jgi:TPR repeat protein
MTFLSSSHARAGTIVLALAFIGGTGCAVVDMTNNARNQKYARDQENARQRRIAAVEQAAAAGDPAARSALASALLSAPDPAPADVQRALALLEQAVAQDDGMAQALLGDILAEPEPAVRAARQAPRSRQEDAERGIALLQRAATKACTYPRPKRFYPSIQPALETGRMLNVAGRADESLLWRARDILHCGGENAGALSWRAQSGSLSSADRIEALALLTLIGNPAVIANARAKLPAADAAAAERLAADLRRRVADSERDYPAPPRKGTP